MSAGSRQKFFSVRPPYTTILEKATKQKKTVEMIWKKDGLLRSENLKKIDKLDGACTIRPVPRRLVKRRPYAPAQIWLYKVRAFCWYTDPNVPIICPPPDPNPQNTLKTPSKTNPLGDPRFAPGLLKLPTVLSQELPTVFPCSQELPTVFLNHSLFTVVNNCQQFF